LKSTKATRCRASSCDLWFSKDETQYKEQRMKEVQFLFRSVWEQQWAKAHASFLY